MKTPSTVMKMPRVLIETLKEKRRPHQSIAGVIEELLASSTPNSIILSQDTQQKLEVFRKHPRETPEDLINSLLAELDAIQEELERIEVVRKQIEPPDNLDDALTLIAILTYDKEELKKQLNNKEN